MSLTSTPRSNRLHIGIFGKRNSGKSSLINALTGQKIALVSDVAGTTADPVYKYMEIHGIGPCMFIDTAGFDDIGELGEMRVGQTRKAMDKTDIALIVWGDTHTEEEYNWIDAFKKRNTPVIPIINKSDILTDIELLASEIKARLGVPPLIVSAKTKEGMDRIREALIRSLPKDHEAESITGNLCADGDLVMLVMPQDTQAPKGRLILPQVQTIRELLATALLLIVLTKPLLAWLPHQGSSSPIPRSLKPSMIKNLLKASSLPFRYCLLPIRETWITLLQVPELLTV